MFTPIQKQGGDHNIHAYGSKLQNNTMTGRKQRKKFNNLLTQSPRKEPSFFFFLLRTSDSKKNQEVITIFSHDRRKLRSRTRKRKNKSYCLVKESIPLLQGLYLQKRPFTQHQNRNDNKNFRRSTET